MTFARKVGDDVLLKLGGDFLGTFDPIPMTRFQQHHNVTTTTSVQDTNTLMESGGDIFPPSIHGSKPPFRSILSTWFIANETRKIISVEMGRRIPQKEI